jgi:hypothetical protein
LNILQIYFKIANYKYKRLPVVVGGRLGQLGDNALVETGRLRIAAEHHRIIRE